MISRFLKRATPAAALALELGILFIGGAVPSGGTELIMRTYGDITIAPTVHGAKPSEKIYNGYRSEFMTYVDFFRVHGIVFNSLLGNTTIISNFDSTGMRLDRIRYTLTPGFRIERKRWIFRGTLHHECIHTIGRREEKGSIWWNSLQLGIGTREAYYLYLNEEYRKKNNIFLNTWDARVDIGYVIPARSTILTGQNHDFVFEQHGLLRYHLGVIENMAFFATLRHNFWVKTDSSAEQQILLTLNLFRKGTKNFAGIFYTYSFYDTFSLDNSEHLGYLGFRILY